MRLPALPLEAVLYLGIFKPTAGTFALVEQQRLHLFEYFEQLVTLCFELGLFVLQRLNHPGKIGR